MLAGSVWQREVVEFSQRRRALVIKMLFPLLIGVPLLFSGAPLQYVAMAFTMLIAIIGALGAGAVLTRERLLGLTVRYRTLPVTPGRLLLERLAINAAIDLMQLLPLLLLVAIRHPGGIRWWPALLVTTAAVLLTGNLLGATASLLSDSPGEVMLYAFIPLLPVLYLSGVFTPLTAPALLVVSRFLPFSYLHEALIGSLGGQPNLLLWETVLAGVGFLVGAAGFTGRLGRHVLEAE